MVGLQDVVHMVWVLIRRVEALPSDLMMDLSKQWGPKVVVLIVDGAHTLECRENSMKMYENPPSSGFAVFWQFPSALVWLLGSSL